MEKVFLKFGSLLSLMLFTDVTPKLLAIPVDFVRKLDENPARSKAIFLCYDFRGRHLREILEMRQVSVFWHLMSAQKFVAAKNYYF